MQFLSVYLHIPFCRVRCHYCAFNIYTDFLQIFDAYIDALNDEIRRLARGQLVHTIYFGGGTPSLLKPEQIARILRELRAGFVLTDDCEISLEANPADVNATYLAELRALGVNRLSLGMQSALPGELSLYGRNHVADDLPHAFEAARAAGYDNISVDLIYGTPTQSLADWRFSLDAALELSPDHFSLYALQVEFGTEIARRVKYGELPAPDDDLAADMYELASERLASAGYEHYEISTWGRRCHHNLQYWRNLPYLGAGAGAHGCAQGLRTVNTMRPDRYIERLASNASLPFPRTGATQSYEVVTPAQERFETIMLGLRLLKDGLSYSEYQDRYGESLLAQYGAAIEKLVNQNLLRAEDDRLLLTERAYLIANRVFVEFLPEVA